jgi:hypothetical protein
MSSWPGRLTSTWPTPTGSGLFVGAKLAARHGARVSLRPSPYGGTSAIVLMPKTIVAAPARPDAGAQPAARPAVTARPAALDLGSPATLALASRRTGALPPATGQPAAALDGAGRLARTDGPPRRTLPQRTRQASLSPHLRGGPAGSRSAAAAPAPASTRTPEQARNLAASLQTGWLRGRRDDPPAAPRPHGRGHQDFPGPDDEEM